MNPEDNRTEVVLGFYVERKVGAGTFGQVFKALDRAEHVLTPDALLVVQEIAVKNWLVDKRLQGDIILTP